MKLGVQFISFLEKFAFTLCTLGLIGIILDFGFHQKPQVISLLALFYLSTLSINIFASIARYFYPDKKKHASAIVIDIFILLFSVWVIYHHFENTTTFNFHDIFYDDVWLRVAVALAFVRNFSELRFNYRTSFMNPAQLLVSSFLVMILIGTVLLMLPTATYDGISFIDALFTATSAVCITGLVVVDTATYFTEIGQIIIMILIQIGGLGILTFASYFSYFFKGGSSYDNQMALTSVSYSQKLGEVYSTIKNVFIITFTVEAFCGIMIYFSIPNELYSDFGDKLFFSIFHAISAFCQGGFSTVPDGFFNDHIRFNYGLVFVAWLTFFLGGLGFPIVSNIVGYAKYYVIRLFSKLRSKEYYRPWVFNLNSRINIITTSAITLVAVVTFYILEFSNTLSEHSGIGKFVIALFSSSTPRSAGLNVVDTSVLTFPTIMLVLLLMWIGASPASTGGGIKTSTFAIATLNIFSLARGKSKIEIYRREIADISVRRAFATISLSLIAMGFAVILLTYTDRDKDLLFLAFEVFSAYGTVGLSLGITGELSELGKLIISASMFVGRLTLLTVIIAFFKKVKQIQYKYPTEEITIN